jgi:hypothetical protein
MFEKDVDVIRTSLNSGGNASTALKEAVDAFDTVGRNYARQLCSRVLMTAARRTRWERANFAQRSEVANDLKRDFGIDIARGRCRRQRPRNLNVSSTAPVHTQGRGRR